jgi:hypothetical protein
MTTKDTKRAMSAYVDALIGCSTQLMTILDDMLRYEHAAPDAPAPPVVLAHLLEDTLRHTRAIHSPRPQARRRRPASDRPHDRERDLPRGRRPARPHAHERDGAAALSAGMT